jgi:hypothetical protein
MMAVLNTLKQTIPPGAESFLDNRMDREERELKSDMKGDSRLEIVKRCCNCVSILAVAGMVFLPMSGASAKRPAPKRPSAVPRAVAPAPVPRAAAQQTANSEAQGPPPLQLAESAGDATSRTKCWLHDIAFFANVYPTAQKDFYVLVPKIEFDRDIEELKQAVPQVSDAEIIIRLMRIVAKTRCGHAGVATSSGIGAHAFQHYPITLNWFCDDLVVTAVEPRYKEALACRVVRFGSLSPVRVETLLGPYIPYENQAALRHRSDNLMSNAEILQREKIADANGHLQVTCAKADGSELTMDLAPQPRRRTGKLINATDALNIPPLFCRKRSGENYWFEYLPDTQTMYIRYNSCHEMPELPFVTFAANVFSIVDTKPVQRVILDVRGNGGGSPSVANPLIEHMKLRPRLSARGHFYVLINEGTFSAAMDTAVTLRKKFNPILIGDTSSNTPTHYGSAGDPIELPNSRLTVHYATKYLRYGKRLNEESLDPDIPVPRTLANYIAGRDAALEAALRHPLQ